MIIVLNAESTILTAAAMDGDTPIAVCTLSIEDNRTADEYACVLGGAFALRCIDLKAAEGVIIGSVVPHITPILRQAVKILTGKQPLVVGPGVKTGLNILIDDPAQLGSDLVALSVAASKSYELPLLVLCVSETATTLISLDKNGGYIGGIIVPGMGISQSALWQTAAQLPKISMEPPRKVVGKNTVECMKSGAFFGTAAMLDGLIDRVTSELGAVKTVVCTGDFIDAIAPLCSHSMLCDKYLQLRGLAMIYRKNCK